MVGGDWCRVITGRSQLVPCSMSTPALPHEPKGLKFIWVVSGAKSMWPPCHPTSGEAVEEEDGLVVDWWKLRGGLRVGPESEDGLGGRGAGAGALAAVAQLLK